jgi:hypothetical protein
MRRTILLLAVLAACSSNETTTSAPAPDAGTPAPDADSGTTSPKDAGADTTPADTDAGIGETCIGYGEGETCATVQGKPYGYVCFNGAPPGIEGCTLKMSSSVGNSYCCSENACVEQIDQGSACTGVTGTPHRFECPPTATGNATPPAECEEHNSGSTEVEKYYCCP